MSVANWRAVFLAEYYTTTAKFRKFRSRLPYFFLFGVLFFSYFLRSIVQFVNRGTAIQQPPLDRFFAIVSIFSFFTFFAPVVSPLGRVVYDGNAQSRREVALSSPVKPHELLYGNLLSNLVFFLPFYILVGTASLSAFIGSTDINPLVSSLHIIVTLTLLVTMGLFAGTIITPLVLNFIAGQRNDVARSIVTLLVAGMLLVALPMLQFLIDTLESSTSLGLIGYLPFTLASSIIVYALYGEVVATSVPLSYALLTVYTLATILLGYMIAEKLYTINENTMIKARKGGFSVDTAVRIVARPIPSTSVREMFIALVKSSLRDIEHMARLTIGLAGTVFFIYALSPQGLFRGQRIATAGLERAAVLFSLILSASMTIYIEAAAFLVQHRDMLALIKSAPDAPRKFMLAKLLQMIFIQSPLFIIMLLLLRVLNFSADLNLPLISVQIVLLIFCMTAIVLGIFLLNPADNEEDITNLINLIIFFSVSILIASFPIAQVLGFSPGFLSTIIYYVVIVSFSVFMFLVGVKALEELDLETLSSDFSRKVSTAFLAGIIALSSWNLLPLPAYLIYFSYPNPYLLILLTVIAPLIIPGVYWKNNGMKDFARVPTFRDVLISIGSYLVLLSIGSLLLYLASLSTNFSAPSILGILLGLGVDIRLVIVYIFISVTVEELFFRGYLIDFLDQQHLRERYVIITSAVVFALFHILSIISFLFAIVGGIILALLRKKSRSLVLPIVVHLSYNLTLILIGI